MSTQFSISPDCYDHRPCFARGLTGKCGCLSVTYPGKPCPFCKPKRDVTNGIKYPYNSDMYHKYSKKKKSN